MEALSILEDNDCKKGDMISYDIVLKMLKKCIQNTAQEVHKQYEQKKELNN